MSTTLIPPTHYIVRSHAGRSQSFTTISEAATAIVQASPPPAAVWAVTGSRRRALTASELRALGADIRQARLRAAGVERRSTVTRS